MTALPEISEDLCRATRPEGRKWHGLGITCGDGWFNLLDALSSTLQFQTDHCRALQVIAIQVKEKFGALSFYRREVSGAQHGMISLAEAMSTRICENCGVSTPVKYTLADRRSERGLTEA